MEEHRYIYRPLLWRSRGIAADRNCGGAEVVTDRHCGGAEVVTDRYCGVEVAANVIVEEQGAEAEMGKSRPSIKTP